MQAGKVHGQKQALIDGGTAGWAKGVELGMEVSYMQYQCCLRCL